MAVLAAHAALLSIRMSVSQSLHASNPRMIGPEGKSLRLIFEALGAIYMRKLSRRICLISSNLPHSLEGWATYSPRGLPMLLHGRILRVSALSRVTGPPLATQRQEKPFVCSFYKLRQNITC